MTYKTTPDGRDQLVYHKDVISEMQGLKRQKFSYCLFCAYYDIDTRSISCKVTRCSEEIGGLHYYVDEVKVMKLRLSE